MPLLTSHLFEKDKNKGKERYSKKNPKLQHLEYAWKP